MRILAIAALVCATAACGAPQEAVYVAQNDAKALLRDSADLEGKRVSIDGYIVLPRMPLGKITAFELSRSPMTATERLALVEYESGMEPNEIYFPVQEEIGSLSPNGSLVRVDYAGGKWVADGGSNHTIREKVRVTGRLGYRETPNPNVTGQMQQTPILTDVTLTLPTEPVDAQG